jgi:hypothetical protein
MLAHCGGGDGFVVTWYDQSENSLDVTQSSATFQPTIVASGVIQTINGKPAISFSGSNNQFIRNAVTMNFYGGSAVHHPTTTTSNRVIIEQNGDTSGPRWYLRHSNGGIQAMLKNPDIVSGATPSLVPQIISGVRTNGANSAIYLNGAQTGTAAIMVTTQTVGSLRIAVSPLGGGDWQGSIAEIITFSADVTVPQRQTLERNQGAYFGITVA